MTNYKFTQPVSMQVNQEQFDYLKPKLEAMGYEINSVSRLDLMPFLCTNFSRHNNWFSNVLEGDKEDYNCHFIDHYNPELFLAIAAMTDAEYGIAGEHWVCIDNGGSTRDFIIGKVYVAVDTSNGVDLIDNQGDKNGWFGQHFKHFRRATLPELISHYTKPKTDMSTETRTVQLSLEQAKTLYEKDKEQYGWLLTTFPELQQPKNITWEGLDMISGYFIGDYSSIHHAANKNKTTSGNKNLYRTEAQARGALAQAMITQLLPVYNGDWVADWDSEVDIKYCITLRRNEWRIWPTTESASLVSLKDRATAERFLTEQSELLEQYKGLFIEPKND